MTGSSLRPAGDRGALVEVPAGTAARVARALARDLPDLVDVVPGHATVLVTWTTEAPDDLIARVERALSDESADAEPRLIEIPVTYDGADLAEVAVLASLSIDDVIELHQRSDHTVAFLGFQPGFAYLVGGDERLHVPRRDEPRTLVPAGSVALAGPYSGVYPRAGPGGWRLIGTTTLTLFDPARLDPALLAPGDRVRFVAA